MLVIGGPAKVKVNYLLFLKFPQFLDIQVETRCIQSLSNVEQTHDHVGTRHNQHPH